MKVSLPRTLLPERGASGVGFEVRLVAGVALVAVGVFAVVLSIVGLAVLDQLREVALGEMGATNQARARQLGGRLETSVAVLHQTASYLAGQDIGRAVHEPALSEMAGVLPHAVLGSTIGLDGVSVAQSDGLAGVYHGDQAWFQRAKSGVPETLELTVGVWTDGPGIVIAVPIEVTGRTVGVAMLVTELRVVESWAETGAQQGDRRAYLVDSRDQALVSSEATARLDLLDVSDEPAVLALRQGERGHTRYRDAAGRSWYAHIEELGDGWAVIEQRSSSDLLSAPRSLLRIAWSAAGVGVLGLVLLCWAVVRQVVSTQGAPAADGGPGVQQELGSQAPVGPGRDPSAGAERPGEGPISPSQVEGGEPILAQRTRTLWAMAEVSRLCATTEASDELVRRVVDLLADQFVLYHVGLYVLDEGGEWAVLRASAGVRMPHMAPYGHRVFARDQSAMARCLQTGEAEALSGVRDAGLWPLASLLPATRAALLLPMRARGGAVGVLALHSDRSEAFGAASVTLFQAVADQVAMAIESIRRAEQVSAQHVPRSQDQADGQGAWGQMLRRRKEWGYAFAGERVRPAEGDWAPEMAACLVSGETVLPRGALPGAAHSTTGDTLAIPLKVRGQTVGVLGCRKSGEQSKWTDREVEVLEVLATQLGDALVSAQLYGAAQESAARQQLVAELAGRMRQTLDVESVLRTAVQDVREALDVPEVVIRLHAGSASSADGAEGRGPGHDGISQRSPTQGVER